MAYASGVRLSSLAGLIGAGVGAYLGYNQAPAVDMEPWMGAAVLGGVGLVAGSAGAFILRSAMQFLIYVVLLGILAYFLRDQIEALTGIDPVSAFLRVLHNFGIPVPGFVEDAVGSGSGG